MISTTLWNDYNAALSAIESVSRTSNIIGEYAEELVKKVSNGQLAPPSQKGYDIDANGVRIQVKATRQEGLPLEGNTSDFHNEEFDKLIGVVFDKKGRIIKVVEVSAAEAISMGHKRSDGAWSISWGKLVNAGHDITAYYINVVLP
ncbi:MAG: hypothetical protein K6F10_06135 [Paludibacteraceae bacterium]|nr:hypothetical protein [Paludibacteraceae bacterium]